MGGCLSHNSSITVSNSVRLIHLDGWIEDYDFPVSVSQVTGSPPKHFVFTAAQLLSTAFKPLEPDALLERGFLYFVVPSSTLKAEVYRADLVNIVKRLTAKAKSSKASDVKSPESTTPSWSQYGSSQAVCSSPAARNPDGVLEKNGVQRCSRNKPWKPLLDTIRERSFNYRRSESDLQMQSGEHDNYQF